MSYTPYGMGELLRLNRYWVRKTGPWRGTNTLSGVQWPGALRNIPGASEAKRNNPKVIGTSKAGDWVTPTGFSCLYLPGAIFTGNTTPEHFIKYGIKGTSGKNPFHYARNNGVLSDHFLSGKASAIWYGTNAWTHYPTVTSHKDAMVFFDELAFQTGVIKEPGFLSKYVATHPEIMLLLYMESKKVDNGHKYRWHLLLADYEYKSPERFFASVDMAQDTKSLFNLIKAAPICGVNLSPASIPETEETKPMIAAAKANVQKVAESFRRVFKSEILADINDVLDASKWGDTKDLQDVIDTFVNNTIQGLSAHLNGSITVQITDKSTIPNNGRVYRFSSMDAQMQIESNAESVTNGSGNAWDLAKGMAIYLFQWEEDQDIYVPKVSFDKQLFIPHEVYRAIMAETEKIRKLAYENAIKATANLYAYEKGIAEPHEDAKDETKNPYLIYSPEDSRQAGAPMFKDISMRPNKPVSPLIKSRRVPLKAFKEAPKRLSGIIRVQGEDGKYRPGAGIVPKDNKMLLLKLAALSVGGYAIYSNVKG
jgi:hypothetical protein